MDATSIPSTSQYERNPTGLLETRESEEGASEIRPLWSTLMEEMLIHYIRANRLLWDPNHPHFTKPVLKRRKVEDIAAIIKRESGFENDFILSPEDVWRKFRNLRTFFVREVRKVNERKRLPHEEPYESKWVHFNRMLFLVDSLKKSIYAKVPLPGEGTNPTSIKIEGTRARIPIENVSLLNDLQQQHQEIEDALRIGGEWNVGNNLGNTASMESSATSSFASSVSRSCDNVISRNNPRLGTSAAKRARLSLNQEKKMAEATEAFGKFITASVRRLPEEKQHSLMAHITQCIADFHKN